MNRFENSSSVGTSFCGCALPWSARYRSRSSAQRFAPDLDWTGDFVRSRWRVPSGSRTRMSTSRNPHFLLLLTLTLIVVRLSPATTHAWRDTLAGRPSARSDGDLGRWDAATAREHASRRCRLWWSSGAERLRRPPRWARCRSKQPSGVSAGRRQRRRDAPPILIQLSACDPSAYGLARPSQEPPSPFA